MSAPRSLGALAGERLDSVYRALPRAAQEAFYDHLTNGTSADYLSDWCSRAGLPVGATTIKRFRRRMNG